jgi:Fe-S-cluster containining protein
MARGTIHNPLEAYRRTQRELRAQFEAFTSRHCPTCATPCCRQPARIAVTDIQLAERTGWRTEIPLSTVEPTAVEGAQDDTRSGRRSRADRPSEESLRPPCQFLAERGCTFPADLRPFGCTAYICRPMYTHLDRATLTRIKRLVRELEERHAMLLRTLPSE